MSPNPAVISYSMACSRSYTAAGSSASPVSVWCRSIMTVRRKFSASAFFSTILTSVLSAVDRLLVSSFTLQVPISISNRFCSVFTLEIFLIPMVFFRRFSVFRSITMVFSAIDIYVLDQTTTCQTMISPMTARTPSIGSNTSAKSASSLISFFAIVFRFWANPPIRAKNKKRNMLPIRSATIEI